jgi:pimeloyl-ACP methyl ester carboxylesterase
MIYRTKDGECKFLNLYDTFLSSLDVTFDEVEVETRFGKTHVLEIGPSNGKPVFVLHGGNSVNAETLSFYLPLCKKYRLYAPDLIGHPGKSAQNQLSTKDLSYGQWASDVVKALDLEPVSFLGTSYGGSIALYTAAYKPEIIDKVVLVVPGSIAMANKISMGMKVIWPLISYRLFGGYKRLLNFVKKIVLEPNELTCQGIKLSFEHLKMNNLLPPLSSEQLVNFKAPILLFCSENDLFFPANKVVPRSKNLFSNSVCETMVLKNSLHYPNKQYLQEINDKIDKFLMEER